MAGTYFCAKCGWKRRKKVDPGRCPSCGSFTQRYQTTWDGVVSDLIKVVAFVAVFSSAAFVWVWLSYPYHDPDARNDFTARFHMDSVSLIDSPNGSVARFSLRNDSRWEIAQTELTVRIHALSRETGMTVVAGPTTTILKKIGPKAEQFLNVPVEGRKGGELFGWTAKIDSVKLAPGYWNQRLEAALSPRLVGLDENIPDPFPQNFPIPPR